jgi:hypothetical protein
MVDEANVLLYKIRNGRQGGGDVFATNKAGVGGLQTIKRFVAWVIARASGRRARTAAQDKNTPVARPIGREMRGSRAVMRNALVLSSELCERRVEMESGR